MSEKSFGSRLIAALEEAVAIDEGTLEPVRVVRRPMTARRTSVARPPHFTPERIQRVRERLQASQSVFAGMLNVSASTVRAWERGVRHPEGASLRLLEVAESHPDAFCATVSPRPGARSEQRQDRNHADGEITWKPLFLNGRGVSSFHGSRSPRRRSVSTSQSSQGRSRAAEKEAGEPFAVPQYPRDP